MDPRRGVAVLFITLAAACGGADETEPQDAPAPAEAPAAPAPAASNLELPEGVTPEMVAQGKTLFNQQICFSCHGVDGAGGPLAPALNDDEWLNVDGSYDAIVQVIQTGVTTPKQFAAPMPPLGGAQLSEEQVRQLAAYIWSASHGG